MKGMLILKQMRRTLLSQRTPDDSITTALKKKNLGEESFEIGYHYPTIVSSVPLFTDHFSVQVTVTVVMMMMMEISKNDHKSLYAEFKTEKSVSSKASACYHIFVKFSSVNIKTGFYFHSLKT